MKTNLPLLLLAVFALPAVPASAQQADYIDAPKGAYIDTGFKPDSNTRVVMDVDVQGAGEYWFGTWNVAWNNGAFALGNDGGNVYVAYGSGGQCGGSGAVVPTGRHVLDYSNGVFRVDGNVHTTRTGTFGPLNYNLYLFAQNRSGSAFAYGTQGTIRCYSCQIYDDGTLVRDFVPTGDPDAGFRDRVGGRFYGNSGSGAMLFNGSVRKKGTWYTSSWNGGFTAATNNILLGKSPSPASGLNGEGSGTYGMLTDGDAVARDKTQTTALDSNASLTYTLGEVATVNEVRIYSTWGDAGRDTLSVKSVQIENPAGEAATLSPSSVSFSGDGYCACATLKMDDGAPLCTNACKVVFNFDTQENGHVGYAELEVVVDHPVDVRKSGVIEIPAGENVTTNLTPADLSIWGPNGGNLTITGSGVVVTQNVPMVKILAGVSFGDYWPWIQGVVTVEDGATLESDTKLFWGVNAQNNNLPASSTRKLVVAGGASAAFEPSSGVVDISAMPQNVGSPDNAWVLVTGTNSVLSLPATTRLSYKGAGKLEVRDGGRVEGGTLEMGYETGNLHLVVDGGTLRFTGGVYVWRNFARWTNGEISMKDCVVETPVYKCAYQSNQFAGDTIVFDGALFRPVGTPAAKFIDGSPTTGDRRILHTITGKGLLVDAPAGASLEVSAFLQGDGGFTKLGAGAVALTAANAYTGATVVEAGTLNVTGSVAGELSVSNGATCVVSLASAPSLGAVSVAGTATFSTPFSATSLALPAGGSVAVTGFGANVGAVSDCAGDFVVSLPDGVSAWPQDTAIVLSSTDAFLAKVAAAMNDSETVPAGYEFRVRNGSVVLAAAGVENGTIEWDGGASDALWSTSGNWNLNRRIYSGDTLVVAAGGVSTNDLGAVAVETATFAAGTAAHAAGASGASDSLKINGSVANLSGNVQTFDLPVSIGSQAFAVNATGDLVFLQGLAAGLGVTPTVTKTGTGALAVSGATWGGGLDLQGGAVVLSGQTEGARVLSSTAGEVRIDGLLDAGGAAVTLGESSPRILGENAVLANGVFSYVPRSGYNYLDLDENQILTLTNNATFTTTSAIFENGTGNQRGVRVLDGSSLVFDNNGQGFISSMNNGTGNFLHASGGSTIVLPKGRTYIAWPNYEGRKGRIDVLDGSFVSGGSVEFAWRAGRGDFVLTDSAASFTDGLYLDIAGNIDYSHSHMFVTRSVVTSGVWRVGNTAGNVHRDESNPDNCTELVFDDATLVPTRDDTAAAPWFLCTKPDCDQIKIFSGGLKVDTTNDVTLAAPLAGAGGLVKFGTGALTLASTNSYTGATIVSNGTLRITGRIAGPIEVAAGTTLALPIPAAGEDVPVVPSIVVEPGAALEALVPGLPQGVTCVDVLHTTGTISLAPQAGDSAHKRFFAGPSKGGMALRYGNPPCTVIIVK